LIATAHRRIGNRGQRMPVSGPWCCQMMMHLTANPNTQCSSGNPA
jgi:hypothetical protein